MIEETYQRICQDYLEFEKLIKKAKGKLFALGVFLVAIVSYLILVRATASPTVNIVATFVIGFLLLLHFADFNYRKSLYETKISIVLHGLEIEKENRKLKSSLFEEYVRSFTATKRRREINKLIFFDILLIDCFNASIFLLALKFYPQFFVVFSFIFLIITCLLCFWVIHIYYKVFLPLFLTQYQLSAKQR